MSGSISAAIGMRRVLLQARIRSAKAACQTPPAAPQRSAAAVEAPASLHASPQRRHPLQSPDGSPEGDSGPAEGSPMSPRTPQPGGGLLATTPELRQLLGLSSDAVSMLAEHTRVVQVGLSVGVPVLSQVPAQVGECSHSMPSPGGGLVTLCGGVQPPVLTGRMYSAQVAYCRQVESTNSLARQAACASAHVTAALQTLAFATGKPLPASVADAMAVAAAATEPAPALPDGHAPPDQGSGERATAEAPGSTAAGDTLEPSEAGGLLEGARWLAEASTAAAATHAWQEQGLRQGTTERAAIARRVAQLQVLGCVGSPRCLPLVDFLSHIVRLRTVHQYGAGTLCL